VDIQRPLFQSARVVPPETALPNSKADKFPASDVASITKAVTKAINKVAAISGPELLQDERVKTSVKKIVKKAIKRGLEEAAGP
jgi:hypothetical protein